MRKILASSRFPWSRCALPAGMNTGLLRVRGFLPRGKPIRCWATFLLPGARAHEPPVTVHPIRGGRRSGIPRGFRLRAPKLRGVRPTSGG